MGSLENQAWLGEAATLALQQMEPGAAVRDRDPTDPARRALCDELFGRGFLLPGGEAEVMRLVRPLNLTAAIRLLVAGTGIGGPAALLANRYGLGVGGYDRLPEPLDLGLAAGQPRLQFAGWDPRIERLPRAEFHHALALHPLHDGPPEPVLAQIVKALRPAGHLVLLEHVATAEFDPADPTARNWMRHERRADPPPNAQDLTRALARLGLQVRETEDLSHLHARLAVYDWKRLMDRLRERPYMVPGQPMLDEANGWTLRTRLTQQGALRLVRWHGGLPQLGAKPAERA